MLIVLDCPGCGKRYEVDESLAGKKSRCKQCGEVFQIPVPRSVSPPSRAPQHTSAVGEWQTAPVEPRPPARSGSGGAPVRPESGSAGAGSKSIVLNCPHCQKRYEIDEVLAGKKFRCKDCNEFFTIPVPRGQKADKSRSRSEVPPPAPNHWGELLGDEPSSLKSNRASGSAAYEETELPPPPRAAYPERARKTSSSYSHRGGDTDAGIMVAGCYLGLLMLLVMGFCIWMGAANPAVPQVRDTFQYMSMFLNIIAAILGLCGGVWLLIIAFTESLAQGLLVLLVPCYSLLFVFSRWQETKGAFALQLQWFANLLAFAVMGGVIGASGKLEALTGVPDGGGAQHGGIPVAGDPQPGFPPPGFAPPQPGPRGFIPGNRGFGPPPGQMRIVPPVAVDRQAVLLTISGIPSNADPALGATAHDVAEAVRKRARELAPTAVRHSWIRQGRQAVMMLSPVDDVQGFANRIDFGTVSVNGNQIQVTLSPQFVGSAPRLPPEQAQSPDIMPGPPPSRPDPAIPADADAVTKSLIQLTADATHTKKDGLSRLMRTQPDEHLAEVVKAVLPLLNDDDGWLVSDVIKVLVVWNTAEVVPALAKRTTDDRFLVRHEAIKALGKLRDPRGVEPVVQRIKDDGFQAEDALKAMGSIAESALIERLTNPDSGVRRRVCEILKEIGGKETLKAMMALPADPDFGVRVAAKDAMSSITLRVGPLTPAERKKATSGSSTRGGSRR